MCGLAGGSRSLGMGFEVSEAYAKTRVYFFLLPADMDVELTAMMCIFFF